MTESPFRALARTNTREMLRDKTTLFGAIIMPVGFIALAVMLSAVLPSEPGVDPVSLFMPFGLTMTLGAIIFFGTVSPIVDLRRRGTLRVLGTTPLRRWTFLLALVPPRAVILLGALALTVVVTAALGSWPPERLASLVVTTVLGAAFMLAIGFLIAAFISTTEAASTILTMVLLAFVFAGGGILPLELLPEGVGDVLEWLPPALFTDALAASLTGAEPTHPVWLAWLVLVATTAVLGAVAGRVFRFDRSRT
ncbi:ABC transporter permease [Halostreptopolyspora alba]|uniref:ABC transporter permease n=1 Tax=Halostreptopolyspora alba TaxID=2487137 RepID=A0A3N0E5Q0_9ACTN|nr:ABC transporter permease [Nocardiopsaceae bacterium YIM 96095]